MDSLTIAVVRPQESSCFYKRCHNYILSQQMGGIRMDSCRGEGDDVVAIHYQHNTAYC